MKKLIRFVVILAGVALVIAAIRQELRKPREQRDWHGRVAGVIPYEFRPPTPHRIKDAVWNHDDERIFTDTAFGVGWAVNLAGVKDRFAHRANGVAAA